LPQTETAAPLVADPSQPVFGPHVKSEKNRTGLVWALNIFAVRRIDVSMIMRNMDILVAFIFVSQNLFDFNK
jgi:hypothetical protein